MNILVAVLVTVVLLASILLIPFGLPGLWMMAVVVLALALLGQLGWTLALVGAGAVAVAELLEFGILRHFGRRYGGSSRAFWGAVFGGMAGLFVGIPVPVVGPVVTAFAGTFLGAGLVTLWETRSLQRSARVGWGVLLARTTAVAMKVGTGVALTGAVALSLLLGR